MEHQRPAGTSQRTAERRAVACPVAAACPVRAAGLSAARGPGRPGQILVLFALLLPVVLALVGLVIDGGRLLAERRHLQAAADAAALAAATELIYDAPARAADAARFYADEHGYSEASGAVLTVSSPPTSGPYAGRAGHVTVRLQHSLALTLAQIMHPGPFPIVVESTAGPSPGPAPYGLLALNRARGGIRLNGAVTVVVEDASAASNYQITGGGGGGLFADLLVLTTQGATGGGSVSGQRGTLTNVPPVPDPFARLAAPAPPLLTWPGLRLVGRGQQVTVQPGRWIGDLQVRGRDNEIRLAPGLYYFDQGAQIDVQGSGNRVIGEGVLIYLGRGSTINLAGEGNLALSASPSPLYSGASGGMVVFAARDNTMPIAITGGASTTLVGTVYAPAAEVRLAGSGTDRLVRGQILADQITASGGATRLVVTYDPGVVALAPRAALLE